MITIAEMEREIQRQQDQIREASGLNSELVERIAEKDREIQRLNKEILEAANLFMRRTTELEQVRNKLAWYGLTQPKCSEITAEALSQSKDFPDAGKERQ